MRRSRGSRCGRPRLPQIVDDVGALMDETTKIRPASLELGDLDTLEAESIFIIREVAAEFEHPVMLFSGGKDSVLMLQLARKAFAPAPVPFPIMHVDTGHNFPEVIEFRDKVVDAVRAAARGRLGPGPDRRGDHQSRPRTGKPQPPPDAGAARRDQGRRLRRRLRRRPARRGQGPRQGAGALLPRQIRPVGPEEPAARAVAPLQRPPPQGRAHPRLPDLRLDRARRLALPGARSRSSCRRSTSPTSARWSTTKAC